ncbi:hypothetical protein BJ138DRAFT_1107961, partial [Hygrophoropsis aurantiaca]
HYSSKGSRDPSEIKSTRLSDKTLGGTKGSLMAMPAQREFWHTGKLRWMNGVIPKTIHWVQLSLTGVKSLRTPIPTIFTTPSLECDHNTQDDNLPEAERTTPADIVDIVFDTLKDAHSSLPIDLFPTYYLAEVVDDHEMGITVFLWERYLTA